MAQITLDNITKRYPDGFEAVKDMSLEIEDGEFVILVGPSGCGKSTALRMIAGLEDITEGELRIGDNVVNDKAPKDRDIAMVFQNYALYPHMTVYNNMAFGLRRRKTPEAEVQKKVRATAELLGLSGYLERRPRELSGGERQRVALGRAMVRDPQVFLFDEPLSNLDAKLRVQMRAEIKRLHQRVKATMIYVTHDQVEAMTLGDRVAAMRDGVLQQFDVPQMLYDRPENLFVAEFIGSPAMNLVGADLVRADGALAIEFGEHRLPVGDELVNARPALRAFEGKPVILGIRPEDLEDASLVESSANGRGLPAVIDIREDMGSEVYVHFGSGGRPVRGADVAAAVGKEAIEATQEQTKEKGSLFVGRLDRNTRAREGAKIELVVDTERLHFFDPETGQGIYEAEAM